MIQEDVEMYIQLPDYDDFRRFDLPIEADLTAISKRVYGGLPGTSWLNLKNHLLITHTPKKLFKSLRETRTQDKKGGIRRERLFRRVDKIPTSRAFNDLAEMDFADDGGDWRFRHLQAKYRIYQMLTFIGTAK